ncbi:MAG: amphi-Trp domain-containing protein [Thermodesulfobacteriota bacterium]
MQKKPAGLKKAAPAKAKSRRSVEPVRKNKTANPKKTVAVEKRDNSGAEDVMKKKSVSMEKVMALKDVIQFLEKLTAGFVAGRVVVEDDSQQVCLNPLEPVKVEVEAKQKKDKGKISIEIGWRLPKPIMEDTGREELSPEPAETKGDTGSGKSSGQP